jgi:recombination protein RecA
MARRKKDEEQQEDTSVIAPADMTDDQRKAEVARLMKGLIKDFNDGDEKIAWNPGNDADIPTNVPEFYSWGSTLIDFITTNREGGGVPCGKIVEVTGEESSGKSLIAAHVMANVQKLGGLVVYADTENSANFEFMQRVGVDLDRLLYLQPGSIEEVFEHFEKTILKARSSKAMFPILLVHDSVAATPPQAEIDGTYDPQSQMGRMAKALARAMRKLTDTLGKERVTILFTNQLKLNPGASKYQDPWVTPGGKAIPYHASVRIRLEKSVKIKVPNKTGGEAIVGIHTRCKVIKTRFSPPFRTCEFDIYFDRGIDDEKSWFAYLHGQKEIEKRNGWCYMDNVPVTVYEGDGVGKVVVQPEWQFREKQWADLIRGDKALEKHVRSLLAKHLVVKFDRNTRSADMQVGESDAEALLEHITSEELEQ